MLIDFSVNLFRKGRLKRREKEILITTMKVVQKVTVVWTATLNVDQLERTRKRKVQKLKNLGSNLFVGVKMISAKDFFFNFHFD